MKKLLACLAVSMLLFSGCTLMNKSEGIVKVNNTVITQAEFDKAFDTTVDKSFLKAFGGSKNFVKSDENPMYGIFKDKIVNELIVKSLLEEEIVKRGITATEEDVQNELKSIIDKVGSKEELNKLLKDRGISNAQFTEDLKTQIKTVIYIGLIFASFVVISYRNSLINESFNENEKLKSNLAAVQKENEQLKVNLENSLNLSNIEKMAEKKLGMQKLDNSQKVYVSLDKEDYVEPASEEVIMEEEKNWFEQLLDNILGK